MKNHNKLLFNIIWILIIAVLKSSLVLSEIVEGDSCLICRSTITGKLWQFPETRHIFCGSCYQDHFNCMAYRKPTDKPIETDAKIIYTDCRQKRLICRSCGEKIIGQYYTYSDDNWIYCSDCVESKPRCDICGLPAGGKFKILSDKRRSCAVCQKTAVNDLETAEGFFDMVNRYLTRELNLKLNRDVLLELVNLNEMNNILWSESGKHDNNTLGLFQRRGNEFKIFVIYGLPLALMIQTICHEYAHAWQAQQYPKLNQIKLKEGFAEWVAYRTLIKLNIDIEADHMTERNDLYGKGLNLFIEAEKREGYTAVIDLIRNN